MSILALSNATGIAYSTLQPHVANGKRLSVRTAETLEKWSKGEMSAAEILGLKPKKRARGARAKAA